MQINVTMNNEKGIVSYMPCKQSKFCHRMNSPSRFRLDLAALSKKNVFTPGQYKLLKTILEGEIENRRCPDALSTCTLGDMGEDKVDSMSLQTIEKECKEVIRDLQLIPNVKNIPKVILILESPHKDEYTVKGCSKDSNCPCIDYIRPAPVRGTTGKNIKRYLPKIFASEEFNEYKVALVNLIQYQCSLGRDDKELKNDIFCNLLKMSLYKSCFGKRLECVYNPQKDILINCCTKGNNRELVWGIIRLALRGIKRENMKFPLLQMNHPSSWYANCRNRSVQIVDQIRSKMIVQKRFFCEKDYVDLWKLLIP